MKNVNVFDFTRPEQIDPLKELLREGVRKMLASAIEAEVADFVSKHSHLKSEDCKSLLLEMVICLNAKSKQGLDM